jgi:hypothetical protein
MQIRSWTRRRVACCASVFFCLAAVASQQEEQSPFMSVGLARQILTAALTEKGITKRPGFDLEYYDGKIPGFYFFTADWDTPRSSMAAGTSHYAVNRVTGDVWEVPGCSVVTARRADRLKAKFVRWLHLKKEDVEAASKLRPCD